MSTRKGSEDSESEWMIGSLKKAIWISRPFAWIFGPSAYAVGVFASGNSLGLENFIQMALLSFPLAFYINGINDIYDIETDRMNPRRGNILYGKPLEPKDIGFVRNGSIIAILMILLSTALFMSPLQFIVVLLFLPVPFIYSAPPIRLKSVPVADSLINFAVAYGPFALGYSLSGSLGFLDPRFVMFSFTFSAVHALGTILDRDEDKKAGIRTFASAYGPRAAAFFATLMFGLNIPFAFSVMSSAGLVISAFTMLAAYAFFRGDRNSAHLAIKGIMLIFLLWVVFLPVSRHLGIEHTNYFWLS